jgi:hypothetical protein
MNMQSAKILGDHPPNRHEIFDKGGSAPLASNKVGGGGGGGAEPSSSTPLMFCCRHCMFYGNGDSKIRRDWSANDKQGTSLGGSPLPAQAKKSDEIKRLGRKSR